jgi:hypothetical protein
MPKAARCAETPVRPPCSIQASGLFPRLDLKTFARSEPADFGNPSLENVARHFERPDLIFRQRLQQAAAL